MKHDADIYDKTGRDLPVCCICGRGLSSDEIALTKKLINRGTERFLCLSCLSCRFGVPEETLRQKVSEFRNMGCTLFT